MIRLAAMNEVSAVPFEKAEGLRCVYDGICQEAALREASHKMMASARSLTGLLCELTDSEDFKKELRDEGNIGVYVVSDKDGKDYGAICLFFPGVMETIHDVLGDFYALPCSVHEWLVLARETNNLEDLRLMVEYVNRTEVLPEDRLSDDVYEYVNGGFRIAR